MINSGDKKKPGMLKRAVALVMLLVIILINTGCYIKIERPAEQDQTDMDEDLTAGSSLKVAHTFYKRGSCIAAVIIRGVYPREEGFYFTDGVLCFYDTANSEKMCICNKAGCSHVDSDCPAVIPGSSCFLYDGNNIYDFSSPEEGIQLITSDLKTGEKTSKILLKNDRNRNVSFNNAYCANGKIVLECTAIDDHRDRSSVYIYDIDKDETTLFLEDDSLSAWGVMGVYRQYVLVSHAKYEEAILGVDEYFKRNPVTADSEQDLFAQYGDYLRSVPRVMEKRLYDLDTMTYTDILPALRGDSDEQPNLDLSSNGPIYGEYILYLLGNQVVRYNMLTGEREVLIERDNVVNGILFDEKLIYITNKNGECKIWIYDIESKETVALYNNGNTQYMELSIYDETKDAFIGYYNGKHVWIMKEDYYSERYDKAIVY